VTSPTYSTGLPWTSIAAKQLEARDSQTNAVAAEQNRRGSLMRKM
jgi:hypothetical protein